MATASSAASVAASAASVTASVAASAPSPSGPAGSAADELMRKSKAEKVKAELEGDNDNYDDDDEPDETLAERLWGLTEMFPETLRSAAGATVDLSLMMAQKMYKFSRAALWIGATSFMILVLPVVFEMENLQLEQKQRLQQRQILLGPNAGLSRGMWGGPTCTSRKDLEKIRYI